MSVILIPCCTYCQLEIHIFKFHNKESLSQKNLLRLFLLPLYLGIWNWMFDVDSSRFRVQSWMFNHQSTGFRVQGSAPPLAADAASLIVKILHSDLPEFQTRPKKQISNVEGRNSIEFYGFKRKSAAIPPFDILRFIVLRFCGSLFDFGESHTRVGRSMLDVYCFPVNGSFEGGFE